MKAREVIWRIVVPAGLVFVLMLVEPGETEQFRAGPPLDYRCSKVSQIPIFVITPMGPAQVIVEQQEPTRFESTKAGNVVRVAPCVRT